MTLVAFTRVSDGTSVEIESSLVAALVDRGANTDVALQGLEQPVRVVGTLAVVSAALGGSGTGSVGTVVAAGKWTGAGTTLFATAGLTINRSGVGDYALELAGAQATANAIVVTLGDDPPVGSSVIANQAAPGPTEANFIVKTLDNLGAAVDPEDLNVVIVRIV